MGTDKKLGSMGNEKKLGSMGNEKELGSMGTGIWLIAEKKENVARLKLL